ncbi:ATP-grasp domain-containing protein [Ramlibacter alkalitolerans]|uniref:ATP-grasp domain-containing protein n=1 Tax=Ramlibacter alkalitolerans TaxID=2039631 RepID=A0ABS1JKE1_9BURK|nr:ATP-grasp domain-containing protein [Ramlibacter alkalitolerans]MBL0424705.1 ATP-grasp domain-containing protein [Ramlibacter alkalitolerans]
MTRIFVYEPLSADDPETARALGPGSAAHEEMRAAGRAMRDALAADLAHIEGVAVTVAAGEQEAGHALRLARPAAGESSLAFVRRQSLQHELCWIVAPESGGLLLRLHEAVGEARWIGCSAAAIRVTASKCATAAVLTAAGVATPLAFAAQHRGAWIVKPDDGAGTLQTRRHPSRTAAQADLQDRRAAGQQAVMEPFVEGEPLSLSMIVGPDLARALAVNRQRLAMDADGWLQDLGVQPAAIAPGDARTPMLHALAARVASAIPGLRGYVGVDVVWNEGGGPVVIEVNPRVTCAYVGLSAILRRNVAQDILALQPTALDSKASADVAA